MPASRPAGYVSDFAGVVSAQGKQRLEALCTELDEKTHSQLAIVTVKSLQGRPIEDFSVELAAKWGIGYKGGPRDAQDQAKKDRGILLLLAIDDHRDRIEVGYGLEPTITDGLSGSILRAIVPNLRSSDYDGALWLAAASLAQPIAQEFGVTLNSLAGQPVASAPEEPDNQLSVLFFLVPIGLLILFSVIARKRGWRGPGGFYGGGFGPMGGGFGGGWGGGGGGGGGFGGFGGGSFGGGGASGSW